jgi:twitching motility protein PilT
MREDPDIIMVGEMRDRETVEAAMELAETGHLVISTMHTSGSVATITRLINFFPSDIQNSVRYKL